MVRTEILEAVCIFLLVRYDLDLRQNPADCLWHLRGKSYHIFFHPDYTVGSGFTPDLTKRNWFVGCHHRWGLPPRPEEINLFLFIIAERCISAIVSLSSKDLVRLFSHHGKNCVFYITADIIRTSKFFFFHAGNLLPAIQSNQLLIGCMTFLQIIQMLFMNI